jgi:hypothetical protein
VAVARGRAAAGDGGGCGDPPVRGRHGALSEAPVHLDDALEAALAVLNAAGLDGLSNEELEELCGRFGVEV